MPGSGGSREPGGDPDRDSQAGRTSTRSQAAAASCSSSTASAIPWFSALDTIDYYDRMTAANGGSEKVRELEPAVSGAGHGALRRRRGGSGLLRSLVCRRRLGREGRGAEARLPARAAPSPAGAARSVRIRSTRATKDKATRRPRPASSAASRTVGSGSPEDGRPVALFQSSLELT